MSRTYRSEYIDGYYRALRCKNQLTQTYYWVQELEEHGYYSRVRDRKLANPHHLNSRDGYAVSAKYESDYVIDNLEELVDAEMDRRLYKLGNINRFRERRMRWDVECDIDEQIRQENIKKIKSQYW